MKIEKIKLSQVSVNNANPRTITGEKFAKLINSILVFPKMMEIRPVVIDNAYKALGGNMRTQALNAIKAMSLEDIQNRLDTQKDYIKMPVEQKKALVTFWNEWLANPTTYIIKADSLSAAEKEQFIIKDNVAYGAWDFDALANKFDNAALNDWGMDVWQMPTATPMGGFTPTAQSTDTAYIPTTPAESENDGEVDIYAGLPEELQGQVLQPAPLPDIQGDDQTLMERVIIVYPKDKAIEMAALLGLGSINKVIYRLDEITGENAK